MSSTKRLTLQSVGLWGHIQSYVIDKYSQGVEIELTNKDICRKHSHAGYLAIDIAWDERLASHDADPDKSCDLQKEGDSDLLFFAIRVGRRAIRRPQGLLLRKKDDLKDKSEEYVRMGIWSTHPDSRSHIWDVRDRLEIFGELDVEQHLNDPRIADMVHTVNTV